MQNRPIDCDVVLPFRNSLEFLQQAFDSIHDQRDVNCAIHIVDDTSTDDTTALRRQCEKILEVYWYRNDRNIGPYRSLHRVFNNVRSDFIAIQDADDISDPQRLSFSLNQLFEKNADIFGGSGITFSEQPEECGQRLESVLPVNIDHRVLNSTMVIRRSFFQRINGFADFFCGADSEFSMRALFAGARFAISDRVVCFVRRHAGSLTRSTRTGMQPKGHIPKWISEYRLRVWNEVERRRALFAAGETNFHHFGCLNPKLSRTVGCIPEPKDNADVLPFSVFRNPLTSRF